MIPPTKRQLECLNFVRAYMAQSGGVAPTLKEIAEGLGLSNRSRAFASDLLSGLQARGHIRRNKGFQRHIEIIEEAQVILSPEVARAIDRYASRTATTRKVAVNELLREQLGMTR